MPTSDDFSRQSFLGANNEAVFRRTRVVIVGLGGGGSHIALQLAHLGIGNYLLIDGQKFDAPNHNRTVGARHQDIEDQTMKIDIAARMIQAIRPWAKVETRPWVWQHGNVPIEMRDAHIIFGCVDGFDQRNQLESFARRYLIPYIDIGMDVHPVQGGHAISGQVILSMPDGPCMRCLNFLNDEVLAREAQKYGAAGINPQVVWPNGTLASTAVGIAVRLLTPWHGTLTDCVYFEYDGNAQTVQPSSRFIYRPATCQHFPGTDALGDPFF